MTGLGLESEIRIDREGEGGRERELERYKVWLVFAENEKWFWKSTREEIQTEVTLPLLFTLLLTVINSLHHLFFVLIFESNSQELFRIPNNNESIITILFRFFLSFIFFFLLLFFLFFLFLLKRSPVINNDNVLFFSRTSDFERTFNSEFTWLFSDRNQWSHTLTRERGGFVHHCLSNSKYYRFHWHLFFLLTNSYMLIVHAHASPSLSSSFLHRCRLWSCVETWTLLCWSIIYPRSRPWRWANRHLWYLWVRRRRHECVLHEIMWMRIYNGNWLIFLWFLLLLTFWTGCKALSLAFWWFAFAFSFTRFLSNHWTLNVDSMTSSKLGKAFGLHRVITFAFLVCHFRFFLIFLLYRSYYLI